MPRIEELYAFVVEDIGPDDEGLIAIQAISHEYGPMWLPLVGVDMTRAQYLEPTAQSIGHQIGKKVTLVRLTNRQDLRVIY
ncbi:MAG: hypothetical protein HWN68_08245 [Desulfobacterales bacterium]|nr:hypothetical protein [Desulfobacterales bacterium]